MNFVKKRCWVEVDDFFWENCTIVIDSSEFETILEWFKIELLEKSSFRSFDFLSLGADLEILGNLDLTLVNLGRDVQGVEEVNLRGIQTSWSSWDSEVNWSNNTNSGFSWDFVSFEFCFEFID